MKLSKRKFTRLHVYELVDASLGYTHNDLVSCRITIEKETRDSHKNIVVDFSQAGHLPTQALGPILNIIRHARENKVKIGLCSFPRGWKDFATQLKSSDGVYMFPNVDDAVEALTVH